MPSLAHAGWRLIEPRLHLFPESQDRQCVVANPRSRLHGLHQGLADRCRTCSRFGGGLAQEARLLCHAALPALLLHRLLHLAVHKRQHLRSHDGGYSQAMLDTAGKDRHADAHTTELSQA